MIPRTFAMTEPHDRSLPFDGYDAIKPALLDTFPYEHPARPIELVLETDEFTAVCPFSGLPDFGAVRITYVPAKKCIELRSLKYYLLSYRTVGIYYEHAVNHILDDLVACCRPREMTVELTYNVRGGMTTSARAHYAARAKRSTGRSRP
jgi:7-cyano-7-deazaguanine reductase